MSTPAIFEAIPEAAKSLKAVAVYAIGVGSSALIAYRVRRNLNLLKHLGQLREEDRLPALRAEMGREVYLKAGVSAEEYLKIQRDSYYFRGFVALLLTVLGVLGIATWTADKSIIVNFFSQYLLPNEDRSPNSKQNSATSSQENPKGRITDQSPPESSPIPTGESKPEASPVTPVDTPITREPDTSAYIAPQQQETNGQATSAPERPSSFTQTTVPGAPQPPPRRTSSGYTPPATSLNAVAGINFRDGTPLDKWHVRYETCDTSNVCDDRPMETRENCTTSPSRNTAILKLPNNVIFFDSKLDIDSDGSRYAFDHGGGETQWRYRSGFRRTPDSEGVPYISLSPEFVDSAYAGLRQGVDIQLGDIAAVVYKNTVTYAIVADEGHACAVGRGSMKLHDSLGNDPCQKRGENGVCEAISTKGIDKDVLFFVFPNSAKLIASGLSPDNINQKLAQEGNRLMRKLRAPAASDNH